MTRLHLVRVRRWQRRRAHLAGLIFVLFMAAAFTLGVVMGRETANRRPYVVVEPSINSFPVEPLIVRPERRGL